MTSYRNRLLSGTVIPLALGAGVAFAGISAPSAPAPAAGPAAAGAALPAAEPAPLPRIRPAACGPCNPCAAASPCNPCAAANPCNPCNPCAARNPCNPCAAASPCNPCNPCAAGGGAAASQCTVPRLARANPCAAKNPCSPCGAANPCNPCAAKNPCSPCGAANPCNPCAAKNPCSPCGAANPCNPCAAANPCSPCGAANPCNPCAAGGTPELKEAEAAAAYDCILPALKAGYAKSGHPAAKAYTTWRRYNRVSYQSATHGQRYVNNYANETARAYGGFEQAGEMPEGAVIAKDSFSVSKTGQVGPGPLFLMEKMAKGFNAASDDWRYTLIMPTGAVFGATGGKNSAGVKFCAECHAAVGETQDSLFFLPPEYRVR